MALWTMIADAAAVARLRGWDSVTLYRTRDGRLAVEFSGARY